MLQALLLISARFFGPYFHSVCSFTRIVLILFATKTLQFFTFSLDQWSTSVLSVISATDLTLKIKTSLMFVPKFGDMWVTISARPGIVISDLDSLDLLAIKFWLVLEGWWTTVYTAPHQPRILASLKVCISMTVTDCSLVGIDLGILTQLLLMSSLYLSYLCLKNGGSVSWKF